MADHTQTVTNQLGAIMGMGQPNLWGTMVWNDDWGYDADMQTETDKGIANTGTLTVALGQDVVFEGTSNTLTFSDAYGKDFVKEPWTDAITHSGALEAIMRAWGIWDFVFAKPTTDGDEKVFDEFSKVSDGTDAFSKVSDGSTDWTEV
jgi:hypothetical protein